MTRFLALRESLQGILIHSHNDQRGALTSNSFQTVVLGATNVTAIELGDIDGDGFLDILTFARAAGEFVVLWNENEGFAPTAEDFRAVRLRLNDELNSTPRLVDLNGDGFPDLLPQREYIGVNLSGLVPGVIFPAIFAAITNVVTPFGAERLVIADFNGDGATDVGAGSSVFQNVSSIHQSLAGARRMPNGMVVLTVTGKPAEIPRLELSSDLKVWTDVWTDVQISRSGTGNVPIPPNAPYAFFRTKPN